MVRGLLLAQPRSVIYLITGRIQLQLIESGQCCTYVDPQVVGHGGHGAHGHAGVTHRHARRVVGRVLHGREVLELAALRPVTARLL